MRYQVMGRATIICSMKVEAASEEEAIALANESFGSLTNYVGMGGTDKLIGVASSEDGRCILPDSEVEFDDCVPLL